MFKLFTSMMKEEWRIHSTIFGSLSFALFPVMIFGIAFMGSFLIPLFRLVVPIGDLPMIIHAIFVLLGIMVGAFGLIGTRSDEPAVRSGEPSRLFCPEPATLRTDDLLELRR